MLPIKHLIQRLSVLALLSTIARADLTTDYNQLTTGVQGVSTSIAGTPGGIAPFGTASFPIMLGTASPVQAVAAAGHYNGNYDITAARAVGYSHTALFATSGTNGTLFANAVLWASRQAAPAGTVAVVVSNTAVGTYLSGLGYTVRNATSTITSENLSGAHVLILSGQTDYSPTVMTLINGFTAAGGGLLIAQTPWAASAGAFADATAMLDPFGLVMNAETAADTSWLISAATPPAIQSALPAADALIADKEGTTVLTAAERAIAANAIYQTVSTRIDIAAVVAKLDILGDNAHYGRIAPTLAAPINTNTRVVEKMLARYQSKTFDALTPAQLFVHPCAADFPGLPDAGAATVTKTINVTGNTPTDVLMNKGDRSVRFETGLYASPGATISVTIPASMVAQGLEVLISGNGSVDETWDGGNGGTWTFFPKLWRRVALTSTTTQTGSVLGGIITFMVPPGKTLGAFDVTISGAIECPAFVLGETIDAQWIAGIRTRPAPYGYIQNSKLTHYLPKWQLATLDNATAVTAYWKQVMDIADEYYGYTPWRKRGEAATTARYVSAGQAFASYPIEGGWGTTSTEMLDNSRVRGNWGMYHELGHGFQSNFDDAFKIAIGSEVDVNLLPGMVYTILHDRTAWDGAHNTYTTSGAKHLPRAALGKPNMASGTQHLARGLRLLF
jgi:hypothetical protein